MSAENFLFVVFFCILGAIAVVACFVAMRALNNLDDANDEIKVLIHENAELKRKINKM